MAQLTDRPILPPSYQEPPKAVVAAPVLPAEPHSLRNILKRRPDDIHLHHRHTTHSPADQANRYEPARQTIVEKLGAALRHNSDFSIHHDGTGNLVHNPKAREAYSGYCAGNVADAFNKVGIHVQSDNANKMAAHLQAAGFEQVKADPAHYQPVAGDTVIIKPQPALYKNTVDKHGHVIHDKHGKPERTLIDKAHNIGHICVFDGHQWISDARQGINKDGTPRIWPYSHRAENPNDYVILRHPQLAAQASDPAVQHRIEMAYATEKHPQNRRLAAAHMDAPG